MTSFNGRWLKKDAMNHLLACSWVALLPKALQTLGREMTKKQRQQYARNSEGGSKSCIEPYIGVVMYKK